MNSLFSGTPEYSQQSLQLAALSICFLKLGEIVLSGLSSEISCYYTSPMRSRIRGFSVEPHSLGCGSSAIRRVLCFKGVLWWLGLLELFCHCDERTQLDSPHIQPRFSQPTSSPSLPQITNVLKPFLTQSTKCPKPLLLSYCFLSAQSPLR